MSFSRRAFIKYVGITLASLLLSRCVRDKGDEDEVGPTEIAFTCYKVVDLTYIASKPTIPVQRTRALNDVVDDGDINPEATRLAQIALSREMVRALWIQLYELGTTSSEDMDEGQAMQELMVEQHRSALDELVALELLAGAVADQVHVAFEEASFHAWRNNVPVTCYIALPVEYHARDDLLAQANTLNGFEGTIDAQTIDQVRDAVTQDMAFFQAFESADAVDKLLELWQSGEIEASEEAIAAAQFLVELLLAE